MVATYPQRYVMVSSPQSSEGTTYTGFGIAFDGFGGHLQIEDISIDQDLVRKMVELFNVCELPPRRLKRAVIDLLP